MAGFNEILEGGLNNALSKRLGMQSGAPAPSLTPEIFPVISVGVAWEELAFNQGWRRWMTTATQAAVAGQKARFLLQNPTGSGVLIVIEELTLLNDSSSAVAWQADHGYDNIAALATPHTLAEFRDTRQRPSGTGVLRITQTTAAAAVTAISARGYLPALANGGTSPYPGLPILLWDRGDILIGTGSDNTAVGLQVVWSERGMQRSEQLG